MASSKEHLTKSKSITSALVNEIIEGSKSYKKMKRGDKNIIHINNIPVHMKRKAKNY